MPVFQFELEDGSMVDIEAERQPTLEEAQQLIEKTPRVGKAEAFGIGAARSILPSAAFAAGAAIGGPGGAEGGAALGTLAGPGPGTAIGAFVGGGLGALLLGGGFAAAAEFGQDWLLKKYLDKDTYEKLTSHEAAAQAQHPGFSEAGGIAGMLPSFEVAPFKLGQIPFRAALGATVGGLQPLAMGRAPGLSDVAGGAAAMTLFGKGRAPFEGIESLTKKGLGYARGQQKAATVHEPVPAQPQQGAEQVSVQKGEQGIRTEPQTVAQGAQVPLTPNPAPLSRAEMERRQQSQTQQTTPLTPVLKSPWSETAKPAKTASRYTEAELADLQAKGWDMSWPFSPEDLRNPKVRGWIQSHPNIPPEVKDRILSFAPGGANELKVTAAEQAEKEKFDAAERQAIAEAEKQGLKTNVVEETPGDENIPWAGGRFMRPNAAGGIDIHRPNFQGWIKRTVSQLPPEQQPGAIAAVIDEELRHIQIIKALGGLGPANEKMADFWNDLSGFEKRLEHRSYTGVWTPEALGRTLSDSELGHEVVRRRRQKLETGTTSEVAQTVGLEKWTVKSINALSDMVYNARQALGTKASGRQLATWNRILSNLETAKAAASLGATQQASKNAVQGENGTVMGPGPFAIIRAYHGTEHDVDRFKLEKIGSGQGAQTFGWGLYFAEEPEVAKTYAAHGFEGYRVNGVEFFEPDIYDSLPNKAEYEAIQRVAGYGFGGALALTRQELAELADRAMVVAPSDWDPKWRVKLGGGPASSGLAFDSEYDARSFILKAISGEEMSEDFDIDAGGYTFRELGLLKQGILALRDAKIETIQRGGVYHVELDADDHELINWDKPIGDDRSLIEKLKKAGIAAEDKNHVDVIQAGAYTIPLHGDVSGEDIYQAIAHKMAYTGKWNVTFAEPGYGTLKETRTFPNEAEARKFAADKGGEYGAEVTPERTDATDAKARASRLLHSLGIKGIKYADQFSRAREDKQTFNYVVFDERSIKITAKNGKPVSMSEARGSAPAAMERGRPEEEGIQAIRPAVRLISGDIKEGNKGETHNDIMERHRLKGVDVDRRGFMGPQGWIDREQGPDSGREVPGMHATELAKMQEAERAPAAMARGLKAGDPDGDEAQRTAWARHYLELFHKDQPFKYSVMEFNSALAKELGSKKPNLTIQNIGTVLKDAIGSKNFLESDAGKGLIAAIEKMGAAYVRATEEQAFPAAMERGRTPEDWERIRQEQAAKKRKTKQAYEPEQEKMFGIEQMGKKGQVPGEEPPVVEPVSATESGALPSITLEQEANKAITSERPSFHDFASSVQRNVAGFSTVKEPQLRELWEDKVWGHLVTAPGERIEALLKSLQLESKLNPALRKLAGVRGVPQPRRIPDEFTQESSKQRRLAQAAAAFMGEQPDLVRLEQDRKQIELGKRLRRHAITEIGMKLLRESMPEMGLHRTEIGLDDIDFENARVGAGAYHRFTEREASDPDTYTKVLEDRARPDKWSTLTKTRRVAVLVNKDTGAVEVVGAYKHGRQGIEIVDPTGATGVRGKEHFAISNYLGRYRLHASMLLRDPVQFFHQHFDKLSDYANEIEEVALQREKVAELEDAGESAEERKFMSQLFPGEEADLPRGMEPRDPEALPPVGEGVRGEGGSVTGPEAGATRGMMGIGKGFTRGRELMSSEANSLREFVEGVVGKVESREDLTDAINELKELGKLEREPRPQIKGKATGKELVKASEIPKYRFTGQARKAVDAIRKAAHLIMLETRRDNQGLKPEEQVHLTDEQAYQLALDHFYEALHTSENEGDYTQKALRRFAGLVRQDLPATGLQVPGAAIGQAKGIARELTMRQRVPPTVARGPTGERILGTQPTPEITQGRPGAVAPPELLPGGAAAQPEAKAGPPAELGTPIMEQPKSTGKGLYYPKLQALKREGGKPYYSTEAATPQPLPQELKQAWLKALGKGGAPAAFDRAKAKEVVQRSWVDFVDKLKAAVPDFKAVTSRAMTLHDMFARKQGASNIADNQATQMGEMIRLATFEGEARTRAAKKRAELVDRSIAAVLAARVKDKEGNWQVSQNAFDNFLMPDVEVGRRKGLAMMESPDPKERLYGRKVVDKAAKYKEEVEFAREHWQDADMQAAVYAFEQAAEQHRQAMNAQGFQLAQKDNWFPGRYQGDLWMDNKITFAPNKILGTNFGRPKTFDNKFRAFANPSTLFTRERQPPWIPYITVEDRASYLLQHSIARGLHLANDQAWMEWLQTLKDPASKEPIAVKPKLVRGNVEGEDPDTGEIVVKESLIPKPPNPDYVIMRSSPNGPAMAIREGFKDYVATVLEPSKISQYPGIREVHRVASMLKHNLILMLDSFHVARLGQYSLALGAKDWGKSLGYKNGISALTWAEADLPDAVAKGRISKENMDWAMEKVPVFAPSGAVQRTETRHARIQEAIRRGMNAATNADTLYRDAIKSTPFIGELMSKVLSPFNKQIFDKITPGMISESFSKNFERLHKANPKIPYNDLMRDVIRDTNVFYGNLGRQGWFKNATYRDLASIAILAPLWREGLLRKEAMFFSRLTGLSALMGRKGYNPMPGSAYMGTLGRGMAVGLGTWFAAAQAINLISKGHFTWQNDEEGHKLDAWIPSGKGGVWISTLGVFAELTHDLWRLGETKPKVWDAIIQMGHNAAGPIGRMALIGGSGTSPTGQKYTSTAGVFKGMAGELAPTPISLGVPLKMAGIGQPLRPGELLQRGLATLTGTKSTLGTRPSQDIQQKAEKWLRSEGLKYEPMAFVPTDEASYAKLRGAVRNGDISGAKKVLEELRKHKTDSEILHALKVFSRHPFTGTKKHERMFLYSLSDKDLDLYQKATQEKYETYEQAADLILSQ